MMKRVRGELQLWTDGSEAHARIDAETAAGPVLFQASVPLALVRARVIRSLAQKGAGPTRSSRRTEALVGFFGRRLALRRLASAVPKAFVPHGLAAQLAVRNLSKVIPAQLLQRAAQPAPTLPAPSTQASSPARSLPAAEPADDPESEDVEGLGYGDLVGIAPIAAKALTAAASNPKAVAQVKRLGRIKALRKVIPGRRRAASPAPAAAAAAVRSPSARTVDPRGAAAGARGGRLFRNWRRGVE